MSRSGQRVHVIRPQGDLILQIVRNGIVELVLVSSEVIVKSFKRLAHKLAMLEHTSVRPLFTMRQLICTDTNGNALLLLCDLFHERFEQIPPTVTLEELNVLARVCAKYGVSGNLVPWARRWLLHACAHANTEAKHELLAAADRLLSTVCSSQCGCSMGIHASPGHNTTGTW